MNMERDKSRTLEKEEIMYGKKNLLRPFNTGFLSGIK
jgi:hypothetical protein